MPATLKDTSAPTQKTVRSLIESNHFKEAVASVLPTHLTPTRFVRIAIAALTRTPKLAECDANTVLQCLMTLSQFGLEPDGRNAHLIPFWNSQKKSYDCQLIIDYKGLAALAKRSGHVSYVHADAVCENDNFEYNKGVVIKHEVNFKDDRGKAYCYYAMVRFKDGTEQAACMTKAEVDRIKARSRASASGPWVTDYDEMAKKTVFRRLSKWLELSPEFRDAIEADTDALEDLRFENAIPIQRPKITRLKDIQRTGGSEATEPDGGSTSRAPESLGSVGDKSREGADTRLGTTQTPSPSSNEPDGSPAGAPKKKLKKKEAISSEQSGTVTVGPLEGEMLERLATMGRSKEQLVEVAKMFDSLKPEQGWSDIGEEGFGVLLHADNFKLIEAELEKMG